MPALHSTAATLRFDGDDLDPDEITRLLGKAPSSAGSKGAPRISRSTGRELSAYRTGVWSLEASRMEPGNLDAQAHEILSGLTEDLKIWRELAKFGPNLFCGLFMAQENEGISISSETLKRLADRGIEIGLDIYGPMEEREAAS